MQPQLLSQVLDLVSTMFAGTALAAILGASFGGFVYSLVGKSLDRLGDRLAERTNRRLEAEVLELRAQCWRLRARSGRGGA